MKETIGVAAPQVVQATEDADIRVWKSVALHQAVLGLGLALTFIAYCGTVAFDFAYDDRSQVVGNPWIRSWHFVPRYFTTNVWGFHNPAVLGNYYRPLFFLWLRVNYMLFGLRPWGWHLTSLLAHLGVTLLVYYLASKLFGDRLTAATAALIFGIHPVHIEAVAWVSGVTDPSMTFLVISSFLCYLESCREGRRSWAGWAASLGLYALAMLAKETAIVLPLLIFAHQWILGPGAGERDAPGSKVARLRRGIRYAAPYLALIPVYLLVRATALRGLSHVITPLSLSTIALTWPSLLWFYLRLLVWPLGLSPCYETPYISHAELLNFFAPAGGVIGAALILWLWAGWAANSVTSRSGTAKSRAIAFASAWLLVPILPLFNLSVFPKGDLVHDRYLYLPSVGFSLLLALGLRELKTGGGKLFGQPGVQVVSGLALTVLLVLGTVLQSLMWADDLLLYTRGLRAAPSNRIVKLNLGIIACERGLYEPGMKLYRELIEQYPDFWLGYYNLGYAYYKLGNLEEASRYLGRASELNLLSPTAFLYLGLTRMKMGRLNEAEPLLRHAVQAAPEGSPGYHFALGIVLKAQGDLKGALDEFKAELQADPEEQAARDQIAEIEMRLRSLDSGKYLPRRAAGDRTPGGAE